MNQLRILSKLQHFYEGGICFIWWLQLVGDGYLLSVCAHRFILGLYDNVKILGSWNCGRTGAILEGFDARDRGG